MICTPVFVTLVLGIGLGGIALGYYICKPGRPFLSMTTFLAVTLPLIGGIGLTYLYDPQGHTVDELDVSTLWLGFTFCGCVCRWQAPGRIEIPHPGSSIPLTGDNAPTSGESVILTSSSLQMQTGQCPVCGQRAEAALVYCRDCHTPHHQVCWNYNRAHCSIYGCPGQDLLS